MIDHISLETCCGMKNNIVEAKIVPSRFQIEWASLYTIFYRELSEVTNEIDNRRERLADFNLKLKQLIKMFFVLPTLLSRKIKGDGKLLSDLRTRFRHWKLNQWKDLVKDLEADIFRVHGRTADSTPPYSKSAQELQAYVRRGIELISEGQMSRGSKALLSKIISDIASNEAINEQMKSTFPNSKMTIPSLTETQWNEERASIDREILRTTIMQLKSKVSPAFVMNTYKQSSPVHTQK